MKDKAEMMRRVRKERRDLGLVEFRAWVTPEQQTKLVAFLASLKK